MKTSEKIGLRGEARIFNAQSGEMVRKENCIVTLGRLFTLMHLIGKTTGEESSASAPVPQEYKYSLVPNMSQDTDPVNARDENLKWFGVGFSQTAMASHDASVKVDTADFTDLMYAGEISHFKASDTVSIDDTEIPSDQRGSFIVNDTSADNAFLRMKLAFSTQNIRTFRSYYSNGVITEDSSEYFQINEIGLITAPSTGLSVPVYKSITDNSFEAVSGAFKCHLFSQLKLSVPLPMFGNMSYFVDYRIYA